MEHIGMYRLSYIEGDPRRYDAAPMRPLAKPRTEQFADEDAALARAEAILLDGRFHTVSLSNGENIVTEPRLRIQLGL
jgi:hypothetical protein